jgi:Predicted membrane protein
MERGKTMPKNSLHIAIKAALVASIYVILTILPPFSAISYGPVQFRISEILMFTALFSPVYAVGLFIGCLIANLFGTANPFDIIFGSLATLLAGLSLYKGRQLFLKRKWLAPLPVSIFNAIIVGSYLPFIFMNVSLQKLFMGGFSNLFLKAIAASPILGTMLSVFIGEAVVCYVLGIPFILLLEKHRYTLM